ncbi:MAG: hypothetical protein ACXADY_15335 [Candidatus Hodarchaeales archaeon]|jgi:hypothetical protein
MNSQTDSKKPWETDLANGMVILMGSFFLIFYILFFFNYSAFSVFFGHILGIAFISWGIFWLWIFYKYHLVMNKMSDKIGIFLCGILVILFGFFIPEDWLNPLNPLNWFQPRHPTKELIQDISEDFYMIYSGITGIIFIISGILILRRNHQSAITRFFSLSFLSSGLAWILFIVYNFFPPDNPLLISLTYLIFYTLIFFAMVLLAHSCRALVRPKDLYFPVTFYILMGGFFIITTLLILIDLKHLPWFVNYIGKIREHSIFFAIVYSVSLLLPLGYSVLNLSSIPDWITSDRKRWINRTLLGIVFLIPYPLGETVAGLHSNEFLHQAISPSNPLPQFLFFLMVSNLTSTFASYIILSGVPDDLPKWFFDEIKIRASPELREINPNVKLAKIWEQVDEWQKESKLSPKEMTTQKLEEYVQTTKNLLINERVTTTTDNGHS